MLVYEASVTHFVKVLSSKITFQDMISEFKSMQDLMLYNDFTLLVLEVVTEEIFKERAIKSKNAVKKISQNLKIVH